MYAPVALITVKYSSRREWEVPDSSGLREVVVCFFAFSFLFLARRPVVAHAQFGPGDGHLVHTRRAHLRGEVDDVVLHALKFVLLRGLHVDHRVLVDVFLEDHRLKAGGN